MPKGTNEEPMNIDPAGNRKLLIATGISVLRSASVREEVRPRKSGAMPADL
jgi:hypothetical protein